MVKAILFDFGGVLLRTYTWEPRHRWDARLGLAPGTVEHAFFNSDAGRAAQRGELTLAAHWAALGRRWQLSTDETAQLRHDFWAGDRLDTSLVDLIRRLRRHYAVGLISNYNDGLRQELSDVWNIAELFDPLIISAEVGCVKPDAAIYKLALEQLGAPAASAVFIDDAPANIAGAQTLGMRTIHFEPHVDVRAALGRLGVNVPTS